MSEKDINRWQETITPRDLSKPWTIGSGGSWDMQKVEPIPDSMLAELAKLYNSHGCPWNCRSLPLSPSDREYMYLLYYSMQGLVARMRLAEKKAAPVDDLAMLVGQLVQALRKAAPGHALADRAVDYLRRMELQGSPLRADGLGVIASEAPPKPVAMIEAADAHRLAGELEAIRQAHWSQWTAQENHIAATAVRHLRLLAEHNASGVALGDKGGGNG